MTLTVLIPAHNEEENIANVISSIEDRLNLTFEMVVVNDHSSDGTANIVLSLAERYKNIRLIDNNLAPGFANAIKMGLSNINTEVVVPVMGDLCDDLGTIPLMLEKVREGYDVVCGARYIKGGARIGGSKLKGFLSFFAGRTMSMFIGMPTHDVANAFKMYRKEVIQSMNIESKGFEISMELVLKAYFNGFKITELPTVWRERERGKSNFKMLNLTPDYSRWYLWAAWMKLTRGGR